MTSTLALLEYIVGHPINRAIMLKKCPNQLKAIRDKLWDEIRTESSYAEDQEPSLGLITSWRIFLKLILLIPASKRETLDDLRNVAEFVSNVRVLPAEIEAELLHFLRNCAAINVFEKTLLAEIGTKYLKASKKTDDKGKVKRFSFI